jgi:predicted ester cyclase
MGVNKEAVMQTTAHTEIVRRFIDEVWNQGRSEAIASFTAPGYIDKAYNPPNVDGHRAMVDTLKSIIPDVHWTIDALVAQNDLVMAELTMRGTHLGSFRGIEARGNPIEVRSYRTFRFDGDRIVEHRALLDTDRLLKQMAEVKAA